MRRFSFKVLIAVSIFLFSIPSYVSCQERVDAREEARQHYRLGKDFYAQGRYEQATSEFEKALQLLTSPRIEFQERVRDEAAKTLAPSVSSTTTVTLPPQKIYEKEAGFSKPQLMPSPALETKATEEREYYLEAGDVLDVSVWQIPDLSRSEVIVRPDGKISFPLIGDIKTEGLTITQIDDAITEKLKAYVKSPEVSIMIRRFGEQANKVVVLGEVIGPGIYKFSGPPTIAEVVAAAGGYTKYAVLNSIMIIRGDVRAKPEVLRVNLAGILKSGRLKQNVYLKPNDIVYVPRSFIGKVNTFLEIFQPAINEYLQTLNARHLQQVVRTKGGI